MARGRQQKWICKQCKTEFSVQNTVPKFCCNCGSSTIGRAPSYELIENYEAKRRELALICHSLNPIHKQYWDLKARYDANMNYWKQQLRRGYISREEYDELAAYFDKSYEEDTS